MSRRTNGKHVLIIAVVLACVTVILSTGNFMFHLRVLDRMDLVDTLVTREEKQMTSLTTEWVSGGDKRSLTTVRGEEEAFADFLTRHKAEVAAAKEEFPPDSD